MDIVMRSKTGCLGCAQKMVEHVRVFDQIWHCC